MKGWRSSCFWKQPGIINWCLKDYCVLNSVLFRVEHSWSQIQVLLTPAQSSKIIRGILTNEIAPLWFCCISQCKSSLHDFCCCCGGVGVGVMPVCCSIAVGSCTGPDYTSYWEPPSPGQPAGPPPPPSSSSSSRAGPARSRTWSEGAGRSHSNLSDACDLHVALLITASQFYKQ